MPTAKRSEHFLASMLLMALAAFVFLVGIGWGLPSRASDAFLFGDRTPWTGARILALAPGWGEDANRGADVAAHPLLGRDQPIVVNATDSQRAAIVRRYRLYSDQPDEMITLRALAQMKPSHLQFDPKLYQYGGLWVYPIGGLLKLVSVLHLVRVTPDIAFYLDHPESFGRLYVVMRLYSAAWGLAGVAVMFSLARRISGSGIIAATAAILYILLPTVINAAHEAKPHLAGAVLGLIAVDCALRAMQSGKRRWTIAAGVACGAAASMVLSEGILIFVLPVMGFAAGNAPLRAAAKRGAFLTLAACAAAVMTYCVFNPYVIVHLLGDRAVLQSNLENSAAMYQVPASIDGIFHGIHLLLDGGSLVIFFGMAMVALGSWRRQKTAWILLAATVPGLVVFLMHATGKPGEYARFALPADVLLVLGATVGIGVFKRTAERIIAGTVLCLMLLPFSAAYVAEYGQAAMGRSTRMEAAMELRRQADRGATTLAIDAEPAPYTLPPVDLFRWQIVLLPKDSAMPVDADVRIDPVDQIGAPISWAEKPFRIEVRPGVAAAAKGQR